MERKLPPEPTPLAQEKLELLMDLDRLRDAAEDPDHLLSGIVDLMARRFETDACLLFVAEESSESQELRTVQDRHGFLESLGPEEMDLLRGEILGAGSIEFRESLKRPSIRQPRPSEGTVAVVPIATEKGHRVGTLILIRTDGPFGEKEEELLTFAETQLDSALVQVRHLHELEIKQKELETLYRVDRIRDTLMSLDEMLGEVLNELRRVIPSEVSFVMLYDHSGRQLEYRAVSPDDLLTSWPQSRDYERVAHQAVEEGHLTVGTVGEVGSEETRSIMCVPLTLRTEVLGVFGLVALGPNRFKESDRRLLKAIASQMDTAIFENLEQGRLRQVLGRTVDPSVLDRLLRNSVHGVLEGERQVVTVLYADLRGSTQVAATANPKDLVSFINDFLGEMAEIILTHGGTLDKFMGDEVMALFGAPLPLDDHAPRAVRVGLEMQKTHEGIMRRWQERGLNAPPLGVGISTGEVIVGEMGSDRRSDYTVLGAPANLGARICGMAGPGEVLICPETHRLSRETIEAVAVPNVQFKGFPEEVTVFRVRRPV